MFKRISKWLNDNYNIIIGILSIITGFGFISMPEKIPDWLIVFIGITWIIQGIIRIGEDSYNRD